MSKSLEDLEQAYKDARAEYEADKTEENKQAYVDAKQAFAVARVEQRKVEEADPDHSRGKALASVVDDDNE